MPSRTVETVFRMKHDRAAAQALLRDQKKIDDALQDTARSSARLEDAYTDQERAAERLAAAQRQMAEAQIKAAREGSELYGDIASRTSAFSGLASGLGGGALGERLMIAADILDAVEAAKLMNAEFPALIQQMGLSTASFGAIGVAAAAMTVALLVAKNAFDDVSASAKNVQQQIVGRIDALRQYYDFIGDATSDDLLTRVAELEQRRKMNGQLLEDLTELKAAVASGLDVKDANVVALMGEGAIRALDSLDLLGFGLDELNDAINETRSAMVADETQRRMLTEAYTSGATATADARQRELEATQAQIAGLERAAQQEIANAELIRTGTSEQIALRQQQIQTELDAYRTLEDELEPLISTSDEAAQKLAETRTAIYLLEQESQNLTNNVIESVRAREEAERRAQERQDMLNASLSGLSQGTSLLDTQMNALTASFAGAREQALAYAAAQAEADEKRAIKSQQEQEDFERKRLQDLADHYAAMAQLDADYYRDRQNILEDLSDDLADIDQDRLDDIKDYNKESRRLAEDHRDRLLAIQRTANQDYWEAARNRDTAGALAALRRGKQQLEDENAQYTKEQKRREEYFKDQLTLLDRERRERQKAAQQQLRDLEQQHRREAQARDRAFRQRLAREDQERTIRLQRQQAEYQREDTARRNHYNTVEGATSQHFSSVYNRTQTGFANIEAAYSAHIARVNSIVSGAASPSIGGRLTPEQYALGGTPPLDRIVSVGERRPETAVYANGQSELVGRSGRELALFREPVRIYPTGAAGQNITLNLGGLSVQGTGSARSIARQTAAQVEDMVYQALDNLVNEAG